MENSNRISILLSPELAFILENLSNLTGQTKTSIIQSALVDKIPDYIELTKLINQSSKAKKR